MTWQKDWAVCLQLMSSAWSTSRPAWDLQTSWRGRRGMRVAGRYGLAVERPFGWSMKGDKLLPTPPSKTVDGIVCHPERTPRWGAQEPFSGGRQANTDRIQPTSPRLCRHQLSSLVPHAISGLCVAALARISESLLVGQIRMRIWAQKTSSAYVWPCLKSARVFCLQRRTWEYRICRYS